MIIKKVKNILILTIISILAFNFIGSNVVMALGDEILAQQGQNPTSTTTTATEEDPARELASNPSQLDQEMSVASNLNIATAADGLLGIFTYLERLKVVIIGGVFQFLGTVVATSAGTTGSDNILLITPEDILFNRLAITDINFFNLTSFGSGDHVKQLSGTDNPIRLLKENVASWYMTIRTISMIILIVVLVYIGIRMVLASTSESKANYKQMLINWLVSLAMVFLLHYIILLVININNALVDIIASVSENTFKTNSKWMSEYMTALIAKSFYPLATVSWSAAIVYVCIVALTFIFLIMYIKRMITVAFLILISPVITITYSIDKAGNGKAEAFSSWIKEFFHNVLIQPFHCLIYVAFVSIAMRMLEGTASLAASMLVILTMFFILQAEDLIKKIFGINSQSTGSGFATAAVLSAAYNKLKPAGKAKTVSNVGKDAGGIAKTRPASASLIASNNIVASNASTNTAIANKNNDINRSEQLSRKLYGGEADYEDYRTIRETPEETKQRRMSEAITADYDSTMSYGEKPRNRIYGNLGYVSADNIQMTQSTQTEGSFAKSNDTQDMKMPNVKNNNPKSDWEQFRDGVKTVAGIGYEGIKRGNLAASGLAGATIGSSLAGTAGADIAETIGSIATGKRIQTYSEDVIKEQYNDKKNKLEQYLKDVSIKNDERTLATAFSNHKDGKEYNKEEDIQKAREYLNYNKEKIDKMQNKSEQQYVQALHAMRNVYSKDNFDEEDPNERVIETMQKIVDKDIKPND